MGYPALKPLESNVDRQLKFGVTDIEASEWIKFLCIGYTTKIEDSPEDGPAPSSPADGSTPSRWYYRYFLSLREFIDFIFSEENKREVIYAHFGGKYDFLFIMKEAFFSDEYEIHDIIPRGSGILTFSISTWTEVPHVDDPEDKMVLGKTDNGWKIKKRTIEFRDSSALLPFGLSSLTQDFDVVHKKLEVEYEKITEVTPDLLHYMEWDHKGLYEVLETYHSWPLIKKSGPGHTIASQAMKIFRTFMDQTIYSLNDKADAFVRESYFGGRTEIFKPLFVGDKKYCLSAYDVNSLYPTIMKNFNFPTNFLCWTYVYNPNCHGFYDAEVEVPRDMYIPPLPVMAVVGKNEKLIFPTGRFKGRWSVAEIEYARSIGVKIISTGRGIIFNDGGQIFRGYVDELYAIRKAAKKNSVNDILAKLLMNSCYGRFGLRRDRESVILDDGQLGVKPLAEIKDGKGKKIRLVTEPKHLDNAFSNVAIAAWVTSLSRIYMHKIYLKNPHDLYYTDSVTEDRFIIVKDCYDRIKTITIKEIWDDSSLLLSNVKECKTVCPYKTLSWNSNIQQYEWKEIIKVIRHKSNKKVVISRSNKGASITTDDHSFIDRFNNKLKPKELKTHFSEKNLSNISYKIVEEFDLASVLPDIYDNKFLKMDKTNIWYEGKHLRKNYLKFKRFFKGEELKQLLEIIGYFVTEGSVTDKETGCRYSFSISSEKIDYQERLRGFLNSFTVNFNFNHIKSSKKDKCWKIISGNYLSCIIFKSLCGQKSINKKLPDFIFNLSNENKNILLDAMILGDGSKIFGKAYSKDYIKKNFRFDTTSKKLINQMCLLSSLLGKCYSINYRKSKKSWSIATSLKNQDRKPEIRKYKNTSEFVYDLQVANNNNFFDCEGIIGLHNTDSIFTLGDYTRDDEGLGGLKLEYKVERACFLLPKTYIIDYAEGMINKKTGKLEFKKVVMKGFDKKKISHFEHNDFSTALEGDLRRLKTTNPSKVATFKLAIRKGDFLKMMDEQDREIRSLYDKRIIVKTDKGFDTIPLHLENGKIMNWEEGLQNTYKLKQAAAKEMLKQEKKLARKKTSKVSRRDEGASSRSKAKEMPD